MIRPDPGLTTLIGEARRELEGAFGQQVHAQRTRPSMAPSPPGAPTHAPFRGLHRHGTEGVFQAFAHRLDVDAQTPQRRRRIRPGPQGGPDTDQIRARGLQI